GPRNVPGAPRLAAERGLWSVRFRLVRIAFSAACGAYGRTCGHVLGTAARGRQSKAAQEGGYAIVSTVKIWWPRAELNHRHTDFQSAALPTELLGQIATTM